MAELKKLELQKWAIAKEMDSCTNTPQLMALIMQLSRVTYEIYYLKQKALGLSKKQADKELDELYKKTNLPDLRSVK